MYLYYHLVRIYCATAMAAEHGAIVRLLQTHDITKPNGYLNPETHAQRLNAADKSNLENRKMMLLASGSMQVNITNDLVTKIDTLAKRLPKHKIELNVFQIDMKDTDEEDFYTVTMETWLNGSRVEHDQFGIPKEPEELQKDDSSTEYEYQIRVNYDTEDPPKEILDELHSYDHDLRAFDIAVNADEKFIEAKVRAKITAKNLIMSRIVNLALKAYPVTLRVIEIKQQNNIET